MSDLYVYATIPFREAVEEPALPGDARPVGFPAQMREWDAINALGDKLAAGVEGVEWSGAGTGCGVRDLDFAVPDETTGRQFCAQLVAAFREAGWPGAYARLTSYTEREGHTTLLDTRTAGEA